jgi:hypothetical protein
MCTALAERVRIRRQPEGKSTIRVSQPSASPEDGRTPRFSRLDEKSRLRHGMLSRMMRCPPSVSKAFTWWNVKHGTVSMVFTAGVLLCRSITWMRVGCVGSYCETHHPGSEAQPLCLTL